jgi:peroxidase
MGSKYKVSYLFRLYSESRKLTNVLRLSDHFNRPAVLEQCTGCKHMSDVTRGLVTEPKKNSDSNIDPEVRHFLFRSGRPYGRDMRAIDIQRGRDHGLGRYNDAREFCGFKRAYSWNDYLDHIPAEDLEKMKSIYKSFEDVDLTIGGTFEEDVEGSVLGPVFQCLVLNQFQRSRVGDRLFFENSPKVSRSGFKRSQLDEIRKASLARLVCDNTCGVKEVQTEAFDLLSKE